MHSLSKILSRHGRTITVRMASSDSVSLDAARTVSGDEYRELHGNNKYRLTVLIHLPASINRFDDSGFSSYLSEDFRVVVRAAFVCRKDALTG